MSDRTILTVAGNDRVDFLQGLVTNDVPTKAGSIAYAALLTPQGKFIVDFFVIGDGDRLLLDVSADAAPALAQRLTMYRLRAEVTIEQTDLIVSRGIGNAPSGAMSDPRHEGMGWRHYGHTDISDDTDWDSLRVALGVPATGIELTPDTYILEADFERLNGVDFKKGCYVGQEVTARMKHKTELRKGLAQVQITGTAPEGTPITSDGKPAGTLHTNTAGQALAYLRFDRAKGDLKADQATITVQ